MGTTAPLLSGTDPFFHNQSVCSRSRRRASPPTNSLFASAPSPPLECFRLRRLYHGLRFRYPHLLTRRFLPYYDLPVPLPYRHPRFREYSREGWKLPAFCPHPLPDQMTVLPTVLLPAGRKAEPSLWASLQGRWRCCGRGRWHCGGRGRWRCCGRARRCCCGCRCGRLFLLNTVHGNTAVQP